MSIFRMTKLCKRVECIVIYRYTLFYDFFLNFYIVCSDLRDGRIAVIGIGNNPTLSHIETITTTLKIPYIAINLNTKSLKNKKIDHDFEMVNYARFNQTSDDAVESENYDSTVDDDENEENNKFLLHMHTASLTLMNAIIDLVQHYKWDYVTILYQETLGLEHIHDFVRQSSFTNTDKLFRVQVRQLSKNINEWIYILKDIKLTSSSHIIVDIETKYLREFVRQVC